MEIRQTNAGEREFVERWRRDLAAKRFDVGEAQIVGDDIQNVGANRGLLLRAPHQADQAEERGQEEEICASF